MESVYDIYKVIILKLLHYFNVGSECLFNWHGSLTPCMHKHLLRRDQPLMLASLWRSLVRPHDGFLVILLTSCIPFMFQLTSALKTWTCSLLTGARCLACTPKLSATLSMLLNASHCLSTSWPRLSITAPQTFASLVSVSVDTLLALLQNESMEWFLTLQVCWLSLYILQRNFYVQPYIFRPDQD